jgi:hypothetical protein
MTIAELEAQMAVEEEKADRARRRGDWGTVRLHKESISKQRSMIRFLKEREGKS